MRLSRRTILRGAGAVAIGLPFLDIMHTRAKGGGLFPKRLVIVFTPNGAVRGGSGLPDLWRPTGGETDFTLGPVLEPFEPLRDQLLVLDGINMDTAEDDPNGDPHQRGRGGVLTGIGVDPGTIGESRTLIAGGPSVDQSIAAEIGGATPYRSLEFGVHGNTGYGWYVSHRGRNDPVYPEDDPQQMFERLFADATAAPGMVNQRDQVRASILDSVRTQIAALQPRLGAEDRARLDAHVTSIREIERRLNTGTVITCGAPTISSPSSVHDHDRFPELMDAQSTLLATALACDLTRVATLVLGTSYVPWLGFGDEHHLLSHEVSSVEDAHRKVTQIDRWHSEKIAALAMQLRSIPEGDGTVLDNTVIVWVNELATGDHTYRSMPFLLIGSCGGYFRTGRSLGFGGTPHNRLLVSLRNAMGIEGDTFGDPGYQGALSNLT